MRRTEACQGVRVIKYKSVWSRWDAAERHCQIKMRLQSTDDKS